MLRFVFLFVILFFAFPISSLEFNSEKFDFSFYYKSDFVPFFISNANEDLQETKIENLKDDEDFIFDGTNLLETLDGKDERGIENEEKKEENSEFTYFDKDGNIRRFTYDSEQMTLRKVFKGLDENGNSLESIEIVSVYESKIKKRIFDEKFRLISVENFLLGKEEKAKNLKLVSARKYFYSEKSNMPFKSSEIKTEKNSENKKSIEILFNSKGFISSQSEFLIEIGKETKLPLTKRNITYDDKNRVICDENFIWYYEKGKSSNIVKKHVFEYTDISENPDYSYYEDNNLRLKRNYEDKKSYYEKTFLDDGIWVLTYFEEGIKFSEIVYFGNKEIRRRYFDY